MVILLEEDNNNIKSEIGFASDILLFDSTRTQNAVNSNTPGKWPVNTDCELTEIFRAKRSECIDILASYYNKSRERAVIEAFGQVARYHVNPFHCFCIRDEPLGFPDTKSMSTGWELRKGK